MGDKVGEPLWPSQLRLRMGIKYLDLESLAETSGVPIDAAEVVAEELAEIGVLRSWLAPQCPECLQIWPLFEDEDHITDKVDCPFCESTTLSELMDMFLIYEVVKPLDD